MTDRYYIRIRGEVKGPLTREQITSQIRRKRVGRHHELSTDGMSWQKAGEMAEFFEPAVASRERVVAEPEPVEAVEAIPEERLGQAAASAPAEEWFYTKGGNKLGPVGASDIQMWLSTGGLSVTDLVWNERFENWIPAGDLPQFATAASANSKAAATASEMPAAGFFEIFMGTSKAAKLPGDAVHKYPNLTRYLRIAESSIRIMFVLFLILQLSSAFYVIGEAMQLNNWTYALGGLIAVPIMILFLWLIFISLMAVLEFVRVVIKIEDNTASTI